MNIQETYEHAYVMSIDELLRYLATARSLEVPDDTTTLTFTVNQDSTFTLSYRTEQEYDA